MVDPMGNVLPEAADEVDACAFVFLRIWRVEMCRTAAAGVRGLSTMVLSASSSEILVDDNIMQISEGLISPGVALVDGMATAGRFGGISLSSLAADENIEYNSEELIAPGNDSTSGWHINWKIRGDVTTTIVTAYIYRRFSGHFLVTLGRCFSFCIGIGRLNAPFCYWCVCLDSIFQESNNGVV